MGYSDLEKQREYQRKYYAARKEQWRERNKLRLQRAEAKKNKRESNKNTYFKRKYGIDRAERDRLLSTQKHRCKVCRGKKPGGKVGWVVDHCHSRGHIRGILCNRCNLTLGAVKDSPTLLRKLADYLESNR